MIGKSRFYEEQKETMPREVIRRIQTEGLIRTVRRAFGRNVKHRERFEEAGISPDDITDLDDLYRLPVMDKALLRAHYPLGLSCVEKRAIVEMHMSSGATGTPIVSPYTPDDLEQWAACVARCLRMAGAQQGYVIQITPSFGLFNGGFGFYHGSEALGLFVLPSAGEDIRQQMQLARDFGTRIITGIVSYGIQLMDALQKDHESLPDLEIGIFGAEASSAALRDRVGKALGIETFDIYGMTETGGVGTLGMDCRAHDGIHVWEDHYIVEVLDPETEQPVPDGDLGVLTVTSLTREALPVIRFKTGDLTRIVSRDRCACGRSHLRIGPIEGRSQDLIWANGISFFPRQVEEVLLRIPGVTPHYEIIIREYNSMKDILVNVEAKPNVTPVSVEAAIQQKLGFHVKSQVFPIGSLPRQNGKSIRVFHKDERGSLN